MPDYSYDVPKSTNASQLKVNIPKSDYAEEPKDNAVKVLNTTIAKTNAMNMKLCDEAATPLKINIGVIFGYKYPTLILDLCNAHIFACFYSLFSPIAIVIGFESQTGSKLSCLFSVLRGKHSFLAIVSFSLPSILNSQCSAHVCRCYSLLSEVISLLALQCNFLLLLFLILSAASFFICAILHSHA